jgi:hypothetical protein
MGTRDELYLKKKRKNFGARGPLSRPQRERMPSGNTKAKNKKTENAKAPT